MTELESLGKKLDRFEKSLYEFNLNLEGLFSQGNLDDIEDKISPLDSAKLNSALAYTLNSLYYSKAIQAIIRYFKCI